MYSGCILFAATLAAFAADSSSLSGPVSGAVFDGRSQSVRLVTGYPGASLLADTLISQIDSAEIAPNGGSALIAKGGQLYAVWGLRGTNPVWTPLFSTSQGIDRIVWNRDSSAAAVYSAAASSVTLITNISSAGASQLTMGAPAGISALALPQSATSVIAAVAGGIYSLTAQGPPALLAPATQPVALSLIHQDQDLLLLDASMLQISEIVDYQGADQLVPFATLPAGATSPVAVAASSDGRTVFVADAACNCVSTWDFATQALLNQVSVDNAPAFLKPLNNGRQFVLNAPGDSTTPFWILDTATASVYFVSGGM